MVQFLDFSCPKPYRMYTDSQACLKIATNASKMGMVRHLEIRYHLVRCVVLSGDIILEYCITEDMLADLFTKIVTTAQDKRLAIRFYNDCLMDDKLTGSVYSEGSSIVEESLPEPEEDEYVKRLMKATDKYEAAIAMQPEAASRCNLREQLFNAA